MSTTPHVSADVAAAEVDYPDADGRPVAETPVHFQNLADLLKGLQRWFRADPRTYVSGAMLLYYVPGDPTKRVAPDVFVVRAVDRDKERRSYRVWEEEGRAPDLVIELTSRSTRRQDTCEKLALYRNVLRVREYFLFDPYGEYLRPRLIGYRLSGDAYLPITRFEGRLPSEVAGLHLEAQGRKLRLYDPVAKRWLPTVDERWAEAEKLEAETEKLEAETEKLEAEAERLEAERRANEAQAALEARDAEIERLRRELERQKRGG